MTGPEHTIIHDIAEQLRRNRQLPGTRSPSPSTTSGGIAILFAGERRTELVQAAETLAGELNLPLIRVDLSQAVSTYIGETEKNLKKIFDTAGSTPAILFFDEADALFGKRSEVRDSHDRYANIGIDSLLRRMDEHHGIVIVAAGRKQAIDPAFLRRARFIVEFPPPPPRS
jgi:vesicle-fusing ATPase